MHKVQKMKMTPKSLYLWCGSCFPQMNIYSCHQTACHPVSNMNVTVLTLGGIWSQAIITAGPAVMGNKFVGILLAIRLYLHTW